MDDMAGASPNYDEICSVLEERLVPVFELLGSRLQAIEDKTGEHDDVLHKLVGGFGDAVNAHKRDNYSQKLSANPDIESIRGDYSELYGKDITEELLDKLMGGEMDEAGIPGFVGGYKEKFAKIRGPAADGTVAHEEAPAPEEEAKPEEKTEAPPEEEEPTDMAGKMAKGLGLKLSSPKVPNFKK
jgi:hypothetical protein